MAGNPASLSPADRTRSSADRAATPGQAIPSQATPGRRTPARSAEPVRRPARSPVPARPPRQTPQPEPPARTGATLPAGRPNQTGRPRLGQQGTPPRSARPEQRRAPPAPSAGWSPPVRRPEPPARPWTTGRNGRERSIPLPPQFPRHSQPNCEAGVAAGSPGGPALRPDLPVPVHDGTRAGPPEATTLPQAKPALHQARKIADRPGATTPQANPALRSAPRIALQPAHRPNAATLLPANPDLRPVPAIAPPLARHPRPAPLLPANPALRSARKIAPQPARPPEAVTLLPGKPDLHPVPRIAGRSAYRPAEEHRHRRLFAWAGLRQWERGHGRDRRTWAPPARPAPARPVPAGTGRRTAPSGELAPPVSRRRGQVRRSCGRDHRARPLPAAYGWSPGAPRCGRRSRLGVGGTRRCGLLRRCIPGCATVRRRGRKRCPCHRNGAP